MNKKNVARVAQFRAMIEAGQLREACERYHEEACDHAFWRSAAVDRLRAARKLNAKAKMHPSTRRNLNDDSKALRIIRALVDADNTFGHAADLINIP